MWFFLLELVGLSTFTPNSKVPRGVATGETWHGCMVTDCPFSSLTFVRATRLLNDNKLVALSPGVFDGLGNLLEM